MNNPPPRPTVEERYVYNQSGQLIGVYGPDGQPIREFVHLGRIPVAVATKHGLHYLHSDHLGTPRAVSEPDGPVVWRWTSDPFGTTDANEDPDGDGIRFTLNRRFPGQYLDAETGTHYNYFRTYAPSIGRYTISDPIGVDGGDPNLYRYALSNPTNVIDPMGLEAGSGVIQRLFPAHTAQISRHPIGGNPENQIRYANRVNIVRGGVGVSGASVSVGPVIASALPTAGPVATGVCRAATSKPVRKTACTLGFVTACMRGESLDDLMRDLASRDLMKRTIQAEVSRRPHHTNLPIK